MSRHLSRRQFTMKWLAAGCFVITASAAHKQDMAPEIFQSVYAVADVELDTNPRAAFWQDAKPIYAEVDNQGIPNPAYRTEVRSRWTAKNLYLLFICPYHELYLKPSPETAHETNELWNWDVAELFIGSDF